MPGAFENGTDIVASGLPFNINYKETWHHGDKLRHPDTTRQTTKQPEVPSSMVDTPDSLSVEQRTVPPKMSTQHMRQVGEWSIKGPDHAAEQDRAATMRPGYVELDS